MPRLLGPALIVGGILAVLSPAFVYIVGPSAADEGPITIVVLAAIGFFLPAAALSTATPIAAKISVTSLDTTGAIVGQLSALGTAGALFGTFITGFVLVANMPSQPITWFVGIVLVLLGAVATWPWGRASVAVGVIGIALAIVGSSAIAAPCDYETAYSCAIVRTPEDLPSTRALILDTFVNSVVDLDDPSVLVSRYARVVDAVVDASFTGGFDALYVGGGGYTLPRYYDATRGSTATVLEIDDALPGIAEEELGLVDGSWLTTIVGDARIGVRSVDGPFDVVIGDAFSGRSVPWHLTTQEFIAELDSVLTDDGIYVINVIDHPPLEFVRAELRTLAEVFPHVAVVARPGAVAGEFGGNYVLAGGSEPFDAEAIEGRVTDGEVVLVDDDAVAWARGAMLLTDEFAPVDQLLSRP